MTFPSTYTPEPTRPAGGAQPGTKVLQTWIIGEWDEADAVDDQDPSNLGIYNPRDVCGNPWPKWTCKGSQHARGAAGDVGFPIVLPGGHPEGHKLAAWLVANHAALGVQEVIWADRRWHNGLGVVAHALWPKYHGASRHFDHVHWAQNAPGAAGLTVAMIEAVAPHPTPTPPATPVYEEDAMFLARATGSPEVWLFEPGRMTHVESEGDRDALLAALGGGAKAASISLGTWQHLISDRKQYKD